MSKELSKIFTKEFNETLVHQVTTDFMSNQEVEQKHKKIDPLSVVVEQNQDHKKVLRGRKSWYHKKSYMENRWRYICRKTQEL